MRKSHLVYFAEPLERGNDRPLVHGRAFAPQPAMDSTDVTMHWYRRSGS
jgi:hypothetical protein